MLKNKVQELIVTKKLFNKSDHLLISFSGGPDSVALVCILKELNYTNIELIYFNHAIRSKKEQQQELAIVKTVANQTNYKLKTKTLPVLFCHKNYKVSLETAGHKLRQAYLTHYATLKQKTHILTGHHKDDLIETSFIQLKRGSVYHLGLPLQRTTQQIKIARPLLFTIKKSLIEYCQQKNQLFCIDKTNTDTTITRNKLRQVILPTLTTFDPKLGEHLLELFKRNQSIYESIQTHPLLNRTKIIEHNNYYVCNLKHIINAPLWVQSSLIYLILKTFHLLQHPKQTIKDSFKNPFTCTQSHIDHIINALTTPLKNQHLTINKDTSILCYKLQLIILKKVPSTKKTTLQLNQTQLFEQFNINLKKCNTYPKKITSNAHYCYVNLKECNLSIKYISNTDTFTPYQHSEPVLAFKYLTKQSIPAYEKPFRVGVYNNNKLIWIPGLTIEDNVKCIKTSTHIYKIQIETLTKPITHMISYNI